MMPGYASQGYTGRTLTSFEHPSLQLLEKAGTSPRKIGGQASTLASLLREGVPMPSMWVLDIGPFRDLVETELPREYSPRALLKLRKPMARMERAAQVRTRLLESPLSESLRAALDALWLRLEPLAPWGLVVRASPSIEDDSVAFSAGLSGAELGIRGGDALGSAIQRIWALVFSPRALAHLAEHKIRDVSMAVLIHPLIQATSSGVISTLPPSKLLGTAWAPGEFVLNAWWGLEPQVDGGDAACDVLRLAPDGSVIDGQIARKSTMLEGGTSRPSTVVVSADSMDIPCIREHHRAALAELVHRLSRGGADEIEVRFAIAEDQIFVLQAQRGPRQGFPPGGSAKTIWSRATVTESLSGVVSPLTMSLSEPFVEDSFRHTFEQLGCSVSEEALVADVHGRAYLNLSVLARMAVQLPGMDARSVVQLAGVDGSSALERQLIEVSRHGFYSRLPWTAARQIAEQSTIGTLVERFEAAQIEEEQAIEEIDLVILPDDALVPRLRELQKMLGRATRMLASATTAYVISYMMIERLLRSSEGTLSGRIAQIITAGAPASEAARPAVDLAQIAFIARDEPAARSVLERGDLHGLDDLPLGPTRAALFRFLVDHGYLANLAAELMNPRWNEDATPLLAMLRALLHGGRRGLQAIAEVRARADRERAALEQRISLVDRLAVRSLVERSRRLAGLRERVRNRYLHALALWRKAAIEIDRRLQRVDPSLAPGSVFFCTLDELMAALGTGRPRVDHLVKPRQIERIRDLGLADPPTTFIGAPLSFLLPTTSGSTLHGIAASSGIITGRARVLRDVVRDAPLVQAGEILVTKSADLGLSPLFLLAGGLVTQQGGRLTQGSVVARELGLPAVAGVPSATRVLRTGDLLRINGDLGTIERVSTP